MGDKKSGQGFALTNTWNGIVRSLHTNVDIESAINPTQRIKINAIWDTGATRSLITKQVADRLNLKRVSIEPMSTASDKDVPSNVYLVNITLPNTVNIVGIRAFEGNLNGCDMLIGMDVITLGDFAVTNNNNHTMLSFRIPSMTEIDFCKDSFIEPVRNPNKVGRNDSCPCGSGKKYKFCCGRR